MPALNDVIATFYPRNGGRPASVRECGQCGHVLELMGEADDLTPCACTTDTHHTTPEA